ncbi:efflux RND transporter periplasmic adaptor subunit [Sulfurospirillum arcachonense]|uniref:efflux RND transporter periplasmic adaptor subunit n=1 Tax=Sulfurospirillum arcachonense TaxID=57666 RepID=UPI0004B77635|nr:efflux RND transporter periplasmic adaptor subunit [Sulfurospirillum arcachonense]
MIKKLIISSVLLPLSLLAVDVYATFDVEGLKESKLTLPVTGFVKKLHVKIGDNVNKGQVLLELNNEIEKIDMELSKSDIKLSQISKDQASSIFTRYKKIKDVIDEEQYENVEFAYQKAVQTLIKSQNAYILKKTRVEDRILKAPYNGVVTDLHVELGDGVSGPVTPLISITSYPEVKLVLSFDEKHWNSVKAGQTFKYRVDGLDKELIGKITKVYPSVDPNSRKLKAEVLTKDILPGLFGDGNIVVE